MTQYVDPGLRRELFGWHSPRLGLDPPARRRRPLSGLRHGNPACSSLDLTLWRSLQIEDDDESEYKKTLRWFLVSTILLLMSVALSALSFSQVVRF
jgi:hypothetical protein